MNCSLCVIYQILGFDAVTELTKIFGHLRVNGSKLQFAKGFPQDVH